MKGQRGSSLQTKAHYGDNGITQSSTGALSPHYHQCTAKGFPGAKEAPWTVRGAAGGSSCRRVPAAGGIQLHKGSSCRGIQLQEGSSCRRDPAAGRFQLQEGSSCRSLDPQKRHSQQTQRNAAPFLQVWRILLVRSSILCLECLSAICFEHFSAWNAHIVDPS